MRRISILCTIIALTCILCGCMKEENQDTEMKLWEENAKLSAEETPEELYEKALKEDTLVIYSVSTRVMDVKETFEKEYPGLTVSCYDVRGNDLINKLENNYEKKDYACDIVLCSDNTGQISNELLPKGIVCKYVPYDMEDKFYSYCNGEVLTLMGEVQQLVYNTQAYEEQPVHNWWELTEERFRGKIIFSNPLKSMTQGALFNMIIHESEPMREAYYELYGKEIELMDGENAGEAFIRMLVRNDAIFVNSSDEVLEQVGDVTSDNQLIGIMLSSKVRMSEYGYTLNLMNDIEPFTGTYSPNSIMLCAGSKNLNSAKLFIRWIYGEADGQGVGYQPYLTKGTWSARKDVPGVSEIALEDMKLLQLDTDYIYKNSQNFDTFWTNLMAGNELESK